MNYRRKFTISYFLLVSSSLILLNFQQNIAQYYFQHQNYYEIPFSTSFDSCGTYLDFLFTIGGVKTGVKIPQIDKRQKNVKKGNTTKNDVIENDTAIKSNRILAIRESEKGDKIQIYTQIENKEQNIKITIYNLLGKKVMELYEGPPKDSNQPYELTTSDFPKGIFLIVISGDNFRLREKLIISR